ncbi:MAG TPA: DUF6263 family protein [Chitinophagaceae bacterium]|nr:DUF6263 family protein [Chitinophagaceae bacterium]
MIIYKEFLSTVKGISDQGRRVEFRVLAIDSAGNFIIEGRYKEAMQKMHIPIWGEVGYDTKDSSGINGDSFLAGFNGLFKAELDPLLAYPFQMALSPKGRVLWVRGIKRIRDTLIASVNDLDFLSPEQKKAAIDTIKEMNDQTVAEEWDEFFEVYPDSLISKGAKWERDLEQDSTQKYSYQLSDIHQDSLKIGLSASYLVKGLTQNGDEAKMNMSISGNMVIDQKTGNILWKMIHQDAKGTEVINDKVKPATENKTTNETMHFLK